MTQLYKQGAEARLMLTEFLGKRCMIKERFKKSYRHPELDQILTDQRMRNEIRGIIRCRQAGIFTPAIFYVDTVKTSIYLEYLEDARTLKDFFDERMREKDNETITAVAQKLGKMIAVMHNKGIIHGDLTTSNFLIKSDNSTIYAIDFGLSSIPQSNEAEHKGVDLYVLERAFLSTHPNSEAVFNTILESYKLTCDCVDKVIPKLDEVRLRGRKRTMVG